jgi:hypothetical protein
MFIFFQNKILLVHSWNHSACFFWSFCFLFCCSPCPNPWSSHSVSCLALCPCWSGPSFPCFHLPNPYSFLKSDSVCLLLKPQYLLPHLEG